MIAHPVLVAASALVLILAACGPTEPAPDPSLRTWRGPNDEVSSQGITIFYRRELAQKVPFPTCITVGNHLFRYAEVERQRTGDLVPPGYFYSGFFLDRWRLLTRGGDPADQDTLYVSVTGSTGILGHYHRQPPGGAC